MKRTLNEAALHDYGRKLTTFARVALACTALVVALSIAAPAHSQTLNFTVETSTQGGTAVVPRLTWTTTPAAAGCTASTTPADDNWAGAKAAAGTVILPSINATTSYTLVCTWPGSETATLRWVAPTTNTDGSPYANPGGFAVFYGRSPTALDQSAYLQDPAVRQWTSPPLAVGSWSFGVRAFNAQGMEGPLSNIASKVITAAVNQSRTLEVAVKFPNAPTDLTVE